MIMCGFVINCLRAILSLLGYLVRFVCVSWYLAFPCKNVSRVLLSVNLSGLGGEFLSKPKRGL